jgi:hypothetical protein
VDDQDADVADDEPNNGDKASKEAAHDKDGNEFADNGDGNVSIDIRGG